MYRSSANGGAELIASEVLTYLHSAGVTISHSPRDTPQMNSVTERLVSSLKVKIMYMLLRSSLPVTFLWFAVQCVAHLLNRLPTTVSVFMSTYQCIYGVDLH